MAYNDTGCNRDQLYLLPPRMRDWLPEDHLVWFLLDAVEGMDLWGFHAAHRVDGKGQKAHHPAIMLPVLLYGYCHGERSSRQLQEFRNSGDTIPISSCLARVMVSSPAHVTPCNLLPSFPWFRGSALN